MATGSIPSAAIKSINQRNCFCRLRRAVLNSFQLVIFLLGPNAGRSTPICRPCNGLTLSGFELTFGMKGGRVAIRVRFWLLALTWLPLLFCGFWVFGILHQVLVSGFPMEILVDRFATLWPVILKYLAISLIVLGPIGIPPALLCRRIWQSGNRRTAWAAWIAMAAMTVALFYWHGIPANADSGKLLILVHLLPVWIVVYLAIFSVPLCIAVLLLHGRKTSVTGRDSGHSAPD